MNETRIAEKTKVSHSFTPNELGSAIENMIDKYTLATLLEGIGDICNEKAVHIQANWQDDQLAKEWEYAAKQMYLVMDRIGKL